jgi:ATP-binding cassette subfamily B protein RaxB
MRSEARSSSLPPEYAPMEPLVLDRVNFIMQAGEHVAIVGPSGCGKSTLLKVILGLIDVDEGEILIDDIPLKQFGVRQLQAQVAAVLQEDHLFAGSLIDNIALFDERPDMGRVAQVAAMASLHDDIARMPMRYETLVGDMGSTLSGGQKQRLLIARALYKSPNALLMDEGTSHLDPQSEQKVNAAIAALGITRVIIAHRKETIEIADRIIRLACAG